MGRRNFVCGARAEGDKTTASRYGADLHVWVRGWERGIEVFANKVDGKDEFEVWVTGGSDAKSNGRKMIGTLCDKGFLYSPPTK